MIKFRAWDKETKTMNGMAEIYRNRNQEIELHPRDENIILMQSTNLKDKGDKEIFEGDILGIETDEGEVKVNVFWDSQHALFMFESKKYNEKNALGELVGDNAYPFKIVGNIYENPELLEE
jgi:hypothetical protein